MDGSYIEAVRPRHRNAGSPAVADMPGRSRCAAIIAADAASRVAGLEAATAAMAEAGVAAVRVGNPLNSPLTLQRMLVQIDLDEDGEDADGDDETRLAQLLEERRGAQGRVVLVIERAETLEPAALLSLQRLASAPGSVQVLFVGKPEFWALLDGAGLAPLRRALTEHGTGPAAAAVPASVAPVPAAEPRIAATRSSRGWWIAGAVGLFATFALATAAVLAPGGLFYRAAPQRVTPAPSGVPAEAPAVAPQPAPPIPPAVAAPEPPAAGLPQVVTPARPPTPQAGPPAPQAQLPVPQAPPAPPPAARAETQQARLRSEFDRFLSASGRGANSLTDAQRSALFEQFLSWRSRSAASPAVSSPSGGRVVIHYREGSEAGEAAANRLAAAAAPLAARVQTRVVADTPSAPVIRFFHPEDEARARELAGALRGPGPGWAVKDFGSFRPRPSPGTIEVWVPTR